MVQNFTKNSELELSQENKNYDMQIFKSTNYKI
jgi:hypothetical protein